MKINELISEYTLQGRTCTKDCSGHRAGWYWAKSKGVTNPVSCNSRSPSFNGGCSAAAEYPAMKHPRIRGEKGRFARPVVQVREGYKEAQTDFSKVVDANTAAEVIATYKELVNKNQVTGNERNIDYWRKQGWDAFNKFVTYKSSQPTKTQRIRKKIVGNSVNLQENDDWLIVLPLDKEASCFYGKDSAWCTTKVNANYFENYFYDKKVTLIYLIEKQTGKKWAIAAHPKVDQVECFDQADNPITPEQFLKQTGFDPKDLAKLAHEKYGTTLNNSRVIYTEAMDKIKQYFIDGSYADEVEDLLLYVKNPDLCYRYIMSRKPAEYPESIIYSALPKDASIITRVKNKITPSMLKAMVRINKQVLLYVEGLDSTVTEIIKQDPQSIQYVNNPTVEQQMIAVKQDPSLIRDMRALDITVEDYAIELDPELIQGAYYQSPKSQLIAVNYDPYYYRFIHKPTEETKLAAVQGDYTMLSKMVNPSLQLQLAAVESSDFSKDVFDYIRPQYVRPEMIWKVYKSDYTYVLNKSYESIKNNDINTLIEIARMPEYQHLEFFIQQADQFDDVDPDIHKYAVNAYKVKNKVYELITGNSSEWVEQSPKRFTDRKDLTDEVWDEIGFDEVKDEIDRRISSGTMRKAEATVYERTISWAIENLNNAIRQNPTRNVKINKERVQLLTDLKNRLSQYAAQVA